MRGHVAAGPYFLEHRTTMLYLRCLPLQYGHILNVAMPLDIAFGSP